MNKGPSLFAVYIVEGFAEGCVYMLSTGWQKTDFSVCSQYLCKSVADFKKKSLSVETFDLMSQ